MPRAVGAFLVALLSAIVGVAAYWGWIGGATFAVGPTRLPLVFVMPPVLGLALFQLVFGAMTGCWRGWRFWAVAGPFAAATWGLGLTAAIGGFVSPTLSLALVLALTVGFGLFALRATRCRPGAA